MKSDMETFTCFKICVVIVFFYGRIDEVEITNRQIGFLTVLEVIY